MPIATVWLSIPSMALVVEVLKVSMRPRECLATGGGECTLCRIFENCSDILCSLLFGNFDMGKINCLSHI